MLIFSQNYYFCKIIKFFERNKVRGKLVSVLQIPKKPVESLERMKYTEFVIEAATESQREMLIAELSDYPFDGFTEEEDCLKAYIPEADFRMWRSAIEESLERNRCRYTAAEVPDRNWNTVWESNFEPIDVEGRCRIRAPFHSKNPACEYDVEIMPKMSFGTGHHATTYLMAAEIMDVDFAGKSGLDMGSGTGVLSILAVKRGAVRVDAVDIDEWAYRNGTENIKANGMEGRIVPLQGDASLLAGKRYDFVLANINRNILLADMPVYAATLTPGGMLLVSGILEADISAIESRAAACGLDADGVRRRNGWAAARFVKNRITPDKIN